MNTSGPFWTFVCEHSFVFNSIGISILVAIVVVMIFTKQPEIFVLDQFGYIEGKPDQVVCQRCAASCNFQKTLSKDGELWTEWSCPRCVKLPG
jgi:NAD kinase